MPRAALIGYGLAGRHFHRPLLRAAGFTVTAVVTRSDARRAEVAADLPDADLLASPDDLWRRPALVDLVVIASPPESHAPLALAAIEAGIACVVEKPFALNAEQAHTVAERALQRGVPVIPFHNRRWDSDTLTLRRLIDDGTLGSVWHHESRFERWRPAQRAGAWRDELPASRGGGVLLDLGSHLVDQALHVHGPATLVHASVAARRGGADDDVQMVLAHDNGVTSRLWASAVAAAPGPRLRVHGSSAGLVMPRLDPQEDQLRAGIDPRDPRFGVADPGSATVLRGDVASDIGADAGAWSRFYTVVVAALDGVGAAPVSTADAVAVMRILDAARAWPDLARA